MILIALFFAVLIVLAIIDYIITKNWIKKTVADINKVFDSLKTFLYVLFVDRFISSREDDSEDVEEL